MNEKLKEKAIEAYIQKDAFAKSLGASVEIIKPGHSRVSLLIDDKMTNFHGTTHGGIIFSISDMAFAAACNSHGKTAVALNVSICFVRPSFPGDILVAEAKEIQNGSKTALYTIEIINQKTGKLIAKSQDQAYKKDEDFLIP